MRAMYSTTSTIKKLIYVSHDPITETNQELRVWQLESTFTKKQTIKQKITENSYWNIWKDGHDRTKKNPSINEILPV